MQQETRGAFGGFIGPRTLVDLVRNTVPFVFEPPAPAGGAATRLHSHAFDPLGWLAVLWHADLVQASSEPSPAETTDYFALCLAAHFATAASYVPTDVDTKIRHALWAGQEDAGERQRMVALALDLARWDLRRVSARLVEVAPGDFVSGHDGERLSVLCGGLMAALRFGDAAAARDLEEAVDAELWREARAFDRLATQRGAEIEWIRLAAVLTHNAGDVNQGLFASSWKRIGSEIKLRFGHLAQERRDRYGGAFGRAAAIYRDLLAVEGHRNYPLRRPRALRTSPELLLPVAPFLDAWGERLATWPAWSDAERAEVVSALVEGCRKVRGQAGYGRALAGFERVFPGGVASPRLVPHFGASVRHALKDAALRRTLAVERVSFESGYVKRARAIR